MLVHLMLDEVLRHPEELVKVHRLLAPKVLANLVFGPGLLSGQAQFVDMYLPILWFV